MEFKTKELAIYQEPSKDIKRWIFIVGEKVMMMVVEIAPGARIPWHSHPQEQISYVLKGRAEVRTNDGVFTFSEGTAYYFKSNEPHETLNPGPDKLTVIEVFSPPREDLLRK